MLAIDGEKCGKCSEMASDTDRSVSPSPAKRLKLDHTSVLSDSSVEISIGSVPVPGKHYQDEPSTGMGFHHTVLTGEDSRWKPSLLQSPSRPSELDESQPSTFDISVRGIVGDVQIQQEQQEVEDDDQDEVSSTVTNLSVSGLSDISGQGWKPVVGPMSWVQRQMQLGAKPREILNQLGADPLDIPVDMDDNTLWKIIVDMMIVPPKRAKLTHINTLPDVVNLIKNSKRIIVLTGAGVSVSCGIPDFRSRDGIYSRLAVDFPDLPDPQSMFDINYFSQDPRPFFKFAKEIYPGQFKPSACHRFIKRIEEQGKLLRNYTQNIDTLENVAGIKNVIECHGSFSFASCTKCKHKVTAEDIREDILKQNIPVCPKCFNPEESAKSVEYNVLFQKGIMKPDIVFFGEGLPEAFHGAMAVDKDDCDLLIVIGSSLKVRPVALIPNSIPANVPQILINREPLPHLRFDVELLGDGDVIINQLCHLLGDGWGDLCILPALSEAGQLLPVKDSDDKQQSHHCSVLASDDDASHAVKLSDSETAISLKSNEGCRNLVEEKLRHKSIDSAQESDTEGTSDCNPVSSLRETEAELESRGDNIRPLEVMSMRVSAKERHMSLDSTRDSGIGDSCNSVDSSVDKDREAAVESTADTTSSLWLQANESLAVRLPVDCYHLVAPSRYIFPGAEVFVERPSSSCSDSSKDSDGSSSESSDDSDAEPDKDNDVQNLHEHLGEDKPFSIKPSCNSTKFTVP